MLVGFALWVCLLRLGPGWVATVRTCRRRVLQPTAVPRRKGAAFLPYVVLLAVFRRFSRWGFVHRTYLLSSSLGSLGVLWFVSGLKPGWVVSCQSVPPGAVLGASVGPSMTWTLLYGCSLVANLCSGDLTSASVQGRGFAWGSP